MMVAIIPANDQWAEVARLFGKGLSEGALRQSDQSALASAISGLPEDATPRQILDSLLKTKTYSPEAKQQAIQNYLTSSQLSSNQALRNLSLQQQQERLNLTRQGQEQTQKYREEQLKTQKDRMLRSTTSQQPEEVRQKALAAGFPEEEAALYAVSAPSVQSRMMAENLDLIKRGIRKANILQDGIGRTESPLDERFDGNVTGEMSNNKKLSEGVLGTSNQKPPVEQEKFEWKPQNLGPVTTSERQKQYSQNQRENSKRLSEAKNIVESEQKILLETDVLRDLNERGNLPSGLKSIMIDPNTGEIYKNIQAIASLPKDVQLWVKTINDFTSGASSFFKTSRLTNFDLQTFKSRLPTLLNNTEGRRVILNQMKYMSELENLYHKSELEALKKLERNSSYGHILSEVDRYVSDKAGRLINKIKRNIEASDELDFQAKTPSLSDSKLVMSPDGEFGFVPKDRVEDYKKIGYETEW